MNIYFFILGVVLVDCSVFLTIFVDKIQLLINFLNFIMKQKLQFFMTVIATIFFGSLSNAQCAAGEAEVTIDVTTDAWGYESYWEVTPTGDACGTNTFFSAGNIVVGCVGGSGQIAASGDGGAMANNATTTFIVGCFTIGTCLDLHSIDYFGDGSTQFDILVNGIIVSSYTMSNVGTEVYNFCVTLPAAFDVSIDSTLIGTPYKMVPFVQVSPLSFGAKVNNNGSGDVTNATINLNVMNGVSSVATASSTPIATLTTGTSQFEALSPGYTASAIGMYDFEFVGVITESDSDSSNDTMIVSIEYTDTVLSRENGNVTGSLGIGSGTGTNAKLGQIYNTPVTDTVTSITAFLASPTIGDVTSFSIYDLNGGTPNAEVAATAQFTITSSDSASMVTLMLTSPFVMQANTDYVIMVNENANNIAIGTNNVDYEMGMNWVFWDANGWSLAESVGASFAVNYVLRPNFGIAAVVDTSSVNENILTDANVYPNPTNGNVTVELSEAVNNATLTVYSVNGVAVSSEVVSGSEFNVSLEGLNNGMYIIELNTGSNKGVYRVTKN